MRGAFRSYGWIHIPPQKWGANVLRGSPGSCVLPTDLWRVGMATNIHGVSEDSTLATKRSAVSVHYWILYIEAN